MRRRAEHLRRLALLDDAPLPHHGHAIGDPLDHGEVVRDEEVGDPACALQREQQVEHLCLHRHVERRHDLIADDQRGLHGERACDADALTLTPAQLVRIARRELGPQADLFEQPSHTRVCLGAFGDPVHLDPLAHERADAHPRGKRLGGILEDDLHASPHGAHRRRVKRSDVGPIEVHVPCRGLDQPQDDPPGRRLAGPRLTHECERLPRSDTERDAVHRTLSAEHFDEVARFEQGRTHRDGSGATR